MSVVFAVLLFSFLIFIHELGHFVAAKLSGVQVNEFAMFMGPAIVKWKRGQTQYSIRCIPIGGYCAMEGEDGDSDHPSSFHKAAWWKRLCILLAGAFMNFVAGLLIMVVLYLPVKQVVTPVIDSFESFATVNGENGLQVGDEILSLDGERVYMRSDMDLIFSLNPGNVHDLVVRRDGQKVVLKNFPMELHTVTQEDGTTVQRYGILFSIQELHFGGKIRYAWLESVNTIRTVRLSLEMLLTGKAGLKDMSGPVGIVQMMSDTAQASETTMDAVRSMLYFGGFIAINLAVMNLLPIPALDGGRALALLLTVAIEKMTRKEINPKYEGYIHGVGMVILLGFMAVIMFKDIFALFMR